MPIFAIINPVIGAIGSGEGGTILGNIISGLISFSLLVAALGALVFLLLGGLRWLGSGGDKQRLEAARDTITNAIIGLIIVASVWAVFLLVSNFIGLGTQGPGGFTLPIPTLEQNANLPPDPCQAPGRLPLQPC